MISKNTKLLILINSLNFFYSHRLSIAEEAKNKNFDVIIGYGELGGLNPGILEKKGFTLQHVPMERGGMNIFKELKSLISIWYFFKKEKPDIVHLVTIKPYLYGGIIARILRVPCLVTAVSGLGSLFIGNQIKNKILKILIYPMYRLAFNHSNQIVIFQNKHDANKFINWGILHSDRIRIIKGSGVELSSYFNFKEKDGIIVVCFASRLLIDKGINEFISASKLLKNRGLNVRFIVAGDLDHENPTGLNMNDLKKIKEDGFVEILGFQKDIPELFSSSHIICLPSYREGFPKVLMEAAAAGRAIITTDVPGCRDAIIPDKTGILVPVKDSAALSNAIIELIENPDKRIAMGIAGRELAEKEYDIKIVVDLHIKIYEDLCNNIF